MASPKADFIDYPIAAEGPVTNPKAAPENNPVLRGLPLVVGSQIISRSNAIAKLFYNNGGFNTIKDLPELDDIPYRFHPCVTPLGDSKMLDPEPELLKARNLSAGAKYYTAADYHEMYKSGKITPIQVAETLLSAIKKGQNPPSKYADAWVDTHGKESWTLDAARESTERYVAGKPLGVLDGVPIGLKDDIDMKGYVSHLGLAYRPDLPFFKEAEESLWLVQKLVEAGAVVIGKNCMHEMGADTCGLNIAQGTPTNHCNPSYYPGGSSSGGASSVGAGIVPFAVGTDAAGSIRIPASYNGVYGLITSHHRTGFFELTMASRGPIAASATDLTLAYRIMSQPDPSCPINSRFGVSKPPAPGAKRVIGIYRDWWKQADDPRILDLCDKAIDHFTSKLGYEVVDISIPCVPEARLALSVMCIAEMTEKARRRTPNPADYLSLVGAANRLLLGVGAQTSAADYLKTNAMRELLMRHLAHLFQEYPGLMIVTPTTPLPGWPRSPSDESWGMSDTNKTVRNMMFLFLSNMTGTPAVTVPVGYVDPEQGEGKLPVGLMAVGEWGAEEQLLQWARESQDYLEGTYEGGRIQPKTWFDVLGEAQK